MEDIVFAISKVGASHLPHGVPCQDYSLSFQTEDGSLSMIIVCDGHGSKTYVRSDKGAKLAAEIAKKEIVDFCNTLPVSFYAGKKGTVTSHPLTEDSLWDKEHDESEMTTIEKELAEQNKLFHRQVDGLEEQDKRMCLLFNSICSKWQETIKKDSEENPFSDEERQALGNNRLAKAYGTTLMAYVETKSYWFSFHIGDGRIVAVDANREMTNPVPWDCRCFQNLTTSLCDSNPEMCFRYAFDGTGFFPKAVFCCSDGIEDSYGDYEASPERLHKFYAGILNEFENKGVEDTLKNIAEFLPILSEKGSKDDMSLAGIIHCQEERYEMTVFNDEKYQEQVVECEATKDGLLRRITKIMAKVFE